MNGPYNDHLIRDVGGLYLALAVLGFFAPRTDAPRAPPRPGTAPALAQLVRVRRSTGITRIPAVFSAYSAKPG
ncbi:MAG: hypothetical protein JWP74_3597 [Marmoricola sp.]|nr:hypothetical protein [Marmoricola sp.]